MNPQPLGITQAIIFRLDLHKHDFLLLHTPQKEIRYPPTALLILLSHDFANSGESFASKTLHDLNQVVQLKGPVDADGAGLLR
jgi:hypothetical protein